jgi:hypothetical protein
MINGTDCTQRNNQGLQQPRSQSQVIYLHHRERFFITALWEPLFSLLCGFCIYSGGRVPFIALHYVFSLLCFREKKFSVINKFSLKTWFIFMWWIYTIAIRSKRPHIVPYSGHHFHHFDRLFTNSCRVTGAVSSADGELGWYRKRVAPLKGHCNATVYFGGADLRILQHAGYYHLDPIFCTVSHLRINIQIR